VVRTPSALPKEYGLFRAVVYDAIAHTRAGRRVRFQPDATPIDGSGGTRRIGGRIVDFRQGLLEPTSTAFGFQNSLSLDTGGEVVTLGAEGAFLEDYEVTDVRLSREES